MLGAYNNGGNMLSRSSVGVYTYPFATSARPHAPRTVDGVTFSYDANGNLRGDGVRAIFWTAANKLSHVRPAPGAPLVGFLYGPDGARAKKTSVSTAPRVGMDAHRSLSCSFMNACAVRSIELD